jgi:hypothetical protein
MKTTIFSIALAAGTLFSANAQVTTPELSPSAKTEQKVGLTDIQIEYSRPSSRGRKVFGEVVPFDVLWRTGANKNALFTSSDALVFGNDTLKAGTYALYTLPSAESWDVIFYTDTENWGTPEVLEDEKIALRLKSTVIMNPTNVETFTISIDGLNNDGARLNFTWENTRVGVDFNVPTKTKVMNSITKTMAGPSANDYHDAAKYYLGDKKELKQALVWANKAIEIRGEDAFWMLRTKSLIQAEMGDTKGAITTARKSLASAEKAKNNSYIDMNKASLAEWNKKK